MMGLVASLPQPMTDGWRGSSRPSIAIELERISEGQRFTTRLLTERTAQQSDDGAIPAVTRTRVP